MEKLIKDLDGEYRALDDMVAPLSEAQWEITTPFANWTIREQMCHVAYFEEAARLSATDGDAFTQNMNRMMEGLTNADAFFEKTNMIGKEKSVPELLSWWRKERELLLSAYNSSNPKDRLPWYGPTMSARSAATSRIMEVWAHGQDIADALTIRRPGTDRLKHIAHIGVTTFGWSFINRGLELPEPAVRVELIGPSGTMWSWGPDDAENKVMGPALDFCLVVTKRRNLDDTALIMKGEVAQQWMNIAQAFAGPPEEGPQPGARVTNYND